MRNTILRSPIIFQSIVINQGITSLCNLTQNRIVNIHSTKVAHLQVNFNSSAESVTIITLFFEIWSGSFEMCKRITYRNLDKSWYSSLMFFSLLAWLFTGARWFSKLLKIKIDHLYSYVHPCCHQDQSFLSIADHITIFDTKAGVQGWYCCPCFTF